MNILFDEAKKNNILESIDNALSEMAIALIPLFNIFSIPTKNDTSQRSKLMTFIHFFILFFIFGSFVAITIINSFQSNKYVQEHIENKTLLNPHNSGLSSFESLELIFICIVSIILLKYKFFIHHIISIVIFILTSFFIDLILGNFPDLINRGILYIILSIASVIIDALDYGYQKYMMDVFYYSYWSVSFTIGITNLIIFGIIIVIFLAKGEEKAIEENNNSIILFFSYFNEVDVGVIIAKHILILF